MKTAANLINFEPDLGHQKYIRVILKEIETNVRIGLYEEEKKGPQTLLIDVDLWSSKNYPKNTKDDFIDYDPLRELICEEWPERPHTELLETLAQEVIDFAFKDLRIEAVRVQITKPRFVNVKQVGIELFQSR